MEFKNTPKEKNNSPLVKSKNMSAPGSPFMPSAMSGYVKRLEDARIIQRTLVYIINLPASVSDETTLASQLYFGKYGKIIKVHISAGHHSGLDPTYGAYLTYSNEEEAAVCIRACNDFVLDGKKLSLTFGTTKYCSYFLKNTRCPKPECVFLHMKAAEADTIFRDAMTISKHIQPKDSIFDRLKVRINNPLAPSKLPDFSIVRDRAISDIVGGERQSFNRARVFSRDNYEKSRYTFTMECDEKPVEVPEFVKRLQLLTSPCKESAVIQKKEIEEIIDPLSPVKWFVDVMDVLPDENTHANVIVSKKQRASL